jgi:hypothetical protein
MMASTAPAAATAVAFGAAATPWGPASASASAALCARVPAAAGGMRRSGVAVRCDAGADAQVRAVAKAASVAALEQFKISADRECLAPRLCDCVIESAAALALSSNNSRIVRWIGCVASRLLLQLGLVLVWYRSKDLGGLGKEGKRSSRCELCIVPLQLCLDQA